VDLTPQPIDRPAQRADLPVAEAARTLVVLEVRGLIEALPGHRYSRRMSDRDGVNRG